VGGGKGGNDNGALVAEAEAQILKMSPHYQEIL